MICEENEAPNGPYAPGGRASATWLTGAELPLLASEQQRAPCLDPRRLPVLTTANGRTDDRARPRQAHMVPVQLWHRPPPSAAPATPDPGPEHEPHAERPDSNLDLRFTDDLALYVYVTGVTSSPTFKVQIDGYDDLGNLFPAIAATANIVAGTGAAAPVYIGRHGRGQHELCRTAFPSGRRVSWTCTGGSVTGTEIALWGR